MSNLGQWIEDRAIARGREEGYKIGYEEGYKESYKECYEIGRAEIRSEIILNMSGNGFTTERIASLTNIPLSEVIGIFEKNELNFD